MQPTAWRAGGEALAALAADPNLRDWRAALAHFLDLPMAQVQRYAEGTEPIPGATGERLSAALQQLGRRMSEPGRLADQVQRRNEVGDSDRSSEERQHGPLSPPEAADGGPAPLRRVR